MLKMLSVVFWLLVKVIAWGGLVVPVPCGPNGLGVEKVTGSTVVPLRFTTCVLTAASSDTVTPP